MSIFSFIVLVFVILINIANMILLRKIWRDMRFAEVIIDNLTERIKQLKADK